MRETHNSNIDVFDASGITPAYAGNTKSLFKNHRLPGDHPRVCGKHWKTFLFNLTVQGSPPRMRETRFAQVFSVFSIGITPAYAGNTHANQSTASAQWDHPRVCGKHCLVRDNLRQRSGSPPRMRETLL